jgi:hypothetical protein
MSDQIKPSKEKNRDIRLIRARVEANTHTQEDARMLLAFTDHYRRQINTVAARAYHEYGATERKLNEINLLLGMARRAVDPTGHGCYYSSVDMATCLLDPERINDLREKIAKEYLKSLGEWRVKNEEAIARERAKVKATLQG